MEQQSNIQTLNRWVRESHALVFFGGAGVSTESGIPDFRSVDGLYHQRYADPPETILSHSYFKAHTQAFFDFYRDKLLYLKAQPNAAHNKLAQWEREGKLLAVVTQNIDGLHQAAGSRRVLELHGSVHRNHCVDCGAFYDGAWMAQTRGIPRCPACGGLVKPDVVLYEEPLDGGTLQAAVSAIRQADLLIVGGTSLAVYPAAGLLDYYRGHRLVLVNKTPTPQDGRADLLISGSIGAIFSQLD